MNSNITNLVFKNAEIPKLYDTGFIMIAVDGIFCLKIFCHRHSKNLLTTQQDVRCRQPSYRCHRTSAKNCGAICKFFQLLV